MRHAGIVVLALLLTHATRAQTRIASDIEIRQMEEKARKTKDFAARVSAHVNLSALRHERNESAASQRELETALELTREERNDARREHDLARYARACSWAGTALAGLGRGAEAFAVLEESVRYAADLPGVWNLYSVSMFRLGRAEKAIGTARMSIVAAERRAVNNATVRPLLELNTDRFALAQGLLRSGGNAAAEEAEQVLRTIADSLDSDAFRSLRKSIGKREEFQILTVPRTDSELYLANFNRAHMRLGELYESRGLVEKAGREYQAVVTRRSDEPAALAGLARLATDAQEQGRYLVLSLDANPFAADVVSHYQRHVEAGHATAVTAGSSVGSRVRMAIHQIHDRDFRRAREALEALLKEHPRNDVLLSLLARAALSSGDLAAAQEATSNITDDGLRLRMERLLGGVSSDRPWFLVMPAAKIDDPSEPDLRVVLSLFAANRMSADDRATLDQETFSSLATFEAAEEGALERGTLSGVPFRLQSPTRFPGIASAAETVRLAYRILGATTLGGSDALLLEPIGAEVDE